MEFGGAKGEQTGSLNRVFFKDSGPFWGFGAFLGIRGLFGDSGPFRGFGAFFGDSGPFLGIRGLFWGFVAFLRIRGLFTDLRPFRRFAAFSQIRGFTAKGAKGANEPPGKTFAT